LDSLSTVGGRRKHNTLGTRPRVNGADDRARTGDLDLGKVALYQLSYVRVEVMLAGAIAATNYADTGVFIK
jgi:hypothetical protein